MDQRKAKRFTDDSGLDCIELRLGRDGNGRPVIMEATDYLRLQEMGLIGSLHLAGGKGRVMYPAIYPPLGYLTGRMQILVARVILDAQCGQIVRYLSADKLDLRRSNISLGKGYSRASVDHYLNEVAEAKALGLSNREAQPPHA